MITQDQLAQLAPHARPETLGQLAAELNTSMASFGASGGLSRAHFIAQACHETAGFLHFEECLNYTHATNIAAVWPKLAGRAAALVGMPQALAEAAYGGRMGNRAEGFGDGWRYRGRGIFQLTGRRNYADAGDALKFDLISQPDLVAQPHFAVQTALWFWKTHDCIAAAARDDVEAVTTIINGSARQGLTERRDLTERAKRIFS